jgi:DNA primase catalytic subunit
MLGGRWIKLNRFENMINSRELMKYLEKYVPAHAYMSVMDWLFPERVGLELKSR